jgi:hypothetical protein
MKYKSVFETEYIEPNRPYSQDELSIKRSTLFKYLKLSNYKVYHPKCKHQYYVKEGGKKEKEIIDKNSNTNIGNCSCCWKLNKTPKNFKDCAENIINIYNDLFYDEPKKLYYYDIDVEKCFYTWLYKDNYD